MITLDNLKSCSIDKHSTTLNLLASRRSVESHNFITSWGEFSITLEDIWELTGLPLLGNHVFTNGYEDDVEKNYKRSSIKHYLTALAFIC